MSAPEEVLIEWHTPEGAHAWGYAWPAHHVMPGRVRYRRADLPDPRLAVAVEALEEIAGGVNNLVLSLEDAQAIAHAAMQKLAFGSGSEPPEQRVSLPAGGHDAPLAGVGPDATPATLRPGALADDLAKASARAQQLRGGDAESLTTHGTQFQSQPAYDAAPDAPVSGAMRWRPIETAPEDEIVLIYTTGGWRGCAFQSDGKWQWFGAGPLHPKHTPTHWQPLPEPPEPS